jgi:hypothetical protein
MKAAANSIVVQEPASGDHLRLDRIVTSAVYLAEIR